MYLWSIDLEAVLVSMSCFSLLCEEADIRCGSDEMTANFILPNYHVYEVRTLVSFVILTGGKVLVDRSGLDLVCLLLVNP